MSLNLLTFDNYAIPKFVVTSNIEIATSITTLYISTAGYAASNIGTNAVYTGTTNNVFLLRGVSSLTTLNVTATTTNLVIDLTDTGVTANTYGSATTYPQIDVDQYGRITSAVNLALPNPSFANAQLLENNSFISVPIPASPNFTEIRALSTSWLFGNNSSDIVMAEDGRLRYIGSTTKWFLLSGRMVSYISTSTTGFFLQLRVNGATVPNGQAWCIAVFTAASPTNTITLTNIPVQLSTNQHFSIFMGSVGASFSMRLYGAHMGMVSTS